MKNQTNTSLKKEVSASVKQKAVARWLYFGVFMLVVQILLGGITRLTGSGLSITEWNPLFGAIPPLNEKQWMDSFHQYQQIAQYKFLNSSYTLEEFKSIFFWEWFHRVWARLLGVVFAIGFIYFLVRGYFKKSMIVPFVVLFLLGGLQGLIGWIMVKSGLNDTDLYVNHVKLALHFIAALFLLCYTLWFALKLSIPEEKRFPSIGFRNWVFILIAVLFIQLSYGAFLAGLKAAMVAPTWPGINGSWLPSGLLKNSFVNTPINVQFVHRNLAFVLFILVIIYSIKIWKHKIQFQNFWLSKIWFFPLVAVLIQLVLGILTVTSAPSQVVGHFGLFEYLALLHQMIAMALTMTLIMHYYALVHKM